MSAGRQVLSYATLVLVTASFCAAQNIAPSHSGTVDYFEGDVTIDGAKLVSQVARFSEIKEQSILHTGLGRAEILLTPGVLLRVGENTSVKMLDNRLMSTRVEFLSGTAMVEDLDSGTTIKDPPVTIIYKDFEAQPMRSGVFELKSEPSGKVRVFKGEARVTGNGTSLNVKDGNQVDLTTTMASSKFDAKDGDDLYGWSRDRSAYLSAGNMSSARSLANSGYGNSFGYGNGYAASGWDPAMWRGFSGGWYYNQYLNMYSYLPFAGTMYSPFGYGYYNPMTIGYVYTPGYYWQGSGGARTGTTTGVPLTSLAGAGTSRTGVRQLPRLGNTAIMRPTVSSPAFGIQPGNSTGALTARNGFGSSSPAIGGGVSNVVSNNVRSAAPAVSAAPARASSGRR